MVHLWVSQHFLPAGRCASKDDQAQRANDVTRSASRANDVGVISQPLIDVKGIKPKAIGYTYPFLWKWKIT